MLHRQSSGAVIIPVLLLAGLSGCSESTSPVAHGVTVVIASDLWVARSTRSYASDDGNAVGQADLALWRVPVN